MSPDSLAALHARCFLEAPRPWTAREFRDLIAMTSTLLLSRPGGFALGRHAGPEAELLTLAVDPSARRRGLGSALVLAFEDAAAAGGASDVFLETAVDNEPARGLYEKLGYRPVGRRAGYYTRAGAPARDAIVFSKSIAPQTARPSSWTCPGRRDILAPSLNPLPAKRGSP